MPLTYQIAQKIHAVSGGGDRARDLVDLQLIMANETVDLADVKAICVRLFNYRNKQAWPPIVEKGIDWDSIYDAQSEPFSVQPSVNEAINWVNSLISQIDRA